MFITLAGSRFYSGTLLSHHMLDAFLNLPARIGLSIYCEIIYKPYYSRKLHWDNELEKCYSTTREHKRYCKETCVRSLIAFSAYVFTLIDLYRVTRFPSPSKLLIYIRKWVIKIKLSTLLNVIVNCLCRYGFLFITSRSNATMIADACSILKLSDG